MRRMTILLADDHTVIWEGLRKMLEPEFEVIACVKDGHALVKTAVELTPDLILVDVGMPLLNGLDAARELKKRMPDLKVIFLTMNPDANLAREALKIGASGYLLKYSEGEELLKAVHEAFRGVCYVTPQIRQAMEDDSIPDPKSLPKDLSDRQREVLQMLAEGRSLQEIGDILHLSRHTVRFHKRRIMKELGTKTDAELVQYAVKHSIVSSM